MGDQHRPWLQYSANQAQPVWDDDVPRPRYQNQGYMQSYQPQPYPPPSYQQQYYWQQPYQQSFQPMQLVDAPPPALQNVLSAAGDEYIQREMKAFEAKLQADMNRIMQEVLTPNQGANNPLPSNTVPKGSEHHKTISAPASDPIKEVGVTTRSCTMTRVKEESMAEKEDTIEPSSKYGSEPNAEKDVDTLVLPPPEPIFDPSVGVDLVVSNQLEEQQQKEQGVLDVNDEEFEETPQYHEADIKEFTINNDEEKTSINENQESLPTFVKILERIKIAIIGFVGMNFVISQIKVKSLSGSISVTKSLQLYDAPQKLLLCSRMHVLGLHNQLLVVRLCAFIFHVITNWIHVELVQQELDEKGAYQASS